MTRTLYATCLMAFISMLAPAGVFGQDINVSLTDLTTCGSKVDSLPSFFGPFVNALWFSAGKFSLGSQTTVTIGSQTGGAGAGKATSMPIVFYKPIDECTPGLLQGVTTEFPSGGGGTTGAIYVTRPGQPGSVAPVPYLLIRFELGFIVSSQIADDAVNPLVETVTMQVGRISYTYSPQDATGATLKPVCYAWDFTTNAPWTQGCVA
jgi:type VI protein secretion system component Hcp